MRPTAAGRLLAGPVSSSVTLSPSKSETFPAHATRARKGPKTLSKLDTRHFESEGGESNPFKA